MALIFKTKYFTVETHPEPFVSREEGGHIRIFSKRKITDRTKFNKKEAIEFIFLSMIVGEAMEIAMNNRGVPVVKINYQDMGNWPFKYGKKPVFHLSIFGRAENSKYQIFPEAVQLPDRSTGFYDEFVPLNDEDIKEIRKQIGVVIHKKKIDFK